MHDTNFGKEDEDGRQRVVIEGVAPEVDCGRFPIKRTIGEKVVVEADIFGDGHDSLSAVVLYRKDGDSDWTEVPMSPLVNDRWRGSFRVAELGLYHYTIHAWVDRFKTWSRDLAKRIQAEQDVTVELLIGAELIEDSIPAAIEVDRLKLDAYAAELRKGGTEAARVALTADLAELMDHYSPRRFAAAYGKHMPVVVDRERGRFSTWYEMFPRSTATRPGRHGTFEDCEARLPYISEMGFDVLYLPPIHPIGLAYRKGKNNAPDAGPEDVGSPWAIGGKEGGHVATHPDLGSLEGFRHLVASAKAHGIEIALDIAYQAAHDHPYVREHPDWFRRRPDGTIQYAENPPKKYQDIYPFDFETEAWFELWGELKNIVMFWIENGVRIFRVDNPHTKPFPFWEWLITEIKRDYPEVIFLAEAFTRPKVMRRLAKLGFSQSYTYFAWRNTAWELKDYFTELTQTDMVEYFRPNLWPNTPDILNEYLQYGGRPAFMVRLILAATLGASYGIYGPPFELTETRPREPGSEEYLDSEKYEIKIWDLDRPDSLRHLIARVNRVRRENPALQNDRHLEFHPVSNDQLFCFSKQDPDMTNLVVVVVNLDPHHSHSGWIDLPIEEFGLDPTRPYQMHDLLDGSRYLWHGARNYVEINPRVIPGHVFRVRRWVRTERDFSYYM